MWFCSCSYVYLFVHRSVGIAYNWKIYLVTRSTSWLSGDVPRLPSYGIYISQLVRFARCCTSVLDFHSKNLQITSKLLTQGYRYHKLRKTFGKFFRSYPELLSKFGYISFQEYLSIVISHPVFYGDLVYKPRRVKDTPNFISSCSKIVKHLRRRQYDPVIIERTIGLVLGPSTALYKPFLKHCTLTNKAVGTIWRVSSKSPQRRQGPDLRPLWLLVGTPSAIRPELAFSRAEHSLPYSDVTIYIFAISYLSSMHSLSRMLNDILILDQQWLPNQSDFPPISWPWYRAWPSPIMSGFHGAFATGVACQQGTLTLPDTWFRPHFGTC